MNPGCHKKDTRRRTKVFCCDYVEEIPVYSEVAWRNEEYGNPLATMYIRHRTNRDVIVPDQMQFLIDGNKWDVNPRRRAGTCSSSTVSRARFSGKVAKKRLVKTTSYSSSDSDKRVVKDRTHSSISSKSKARSKSKSRSKSPRKKSPPGVCGCNRSSLSASSSDSSGHIGVVRSRTLSSSWSSATSDKRCTSGRSHSARACQKKTLTSAALCCNKNSGSRSSSSSSPSNPKSSSMSHKSSTTSKKSSSSSIPAASASSSSRIPSSSDAMKIAARSAAVATSISDPEEMTIKFRDYLRLMNDMPTDMVEFSIGYTDITGTSLNALSLKEDGATSESMMLKKGSYYGFAMKLVKQNGKIVTNLQWSRRAKQSMAGKTYLVLLKSDRVEKADRFVIVDGRLLKIGANMYFPCTSYKDWKTTRFSAFLLRVTDEVLAKIKAQQNISSSSSKSSNKSSTSSEDSA